MTAHAAVAGARARQRRVATGCSSRESEQRFAWVPTGAWPTPPFEAVAVALPGAGRCATGRLHGRRRQPAPAGRRRLPRLHRHDRAAPRRRRDQRPLLCGRARACRAAGGTRPRQDRVLLERQPRVPHAADADARRRWRTRCRARRARARPAGARAPQRHAPAQAGQRAARLLEARGGPPAGELRAGRRGGAHRRARGHLQRRLPARGAGLEIDCEALPSTGLSGPGPVGARGAQPRLQCLQGDGQRRDPRQPARRRRDAGALGRRHRSGDRRRRSRSGSSSASTASAGCRRAATRARASACRWCRRSSQLHGGRSASTASSARVRSSSCRSRSAASICRPSTSARSRPPSRRASPICSCRRRSAGCRTSAGPPLQPAATGALARPAARAC